METKKQAAIQTLSRLWQNCGISSGDMVLLHSSAKRILRSLKEMGVPVDPDIVIDSFLDAIGETGTLLTPLFNFDFTSTHQFDIRTTPSHMGILTEYARKRVGVVRTGHPIYSFAVLGAKKNLFKNVNNISGYGTDSPFGILHKENGKIAILDLPDQHSMTFYHYIEEQNQVPYRYFKQFSGDYIDCSGVTEHRNYSLFVRNLEQGVITYVNPMGDRLWEKGLYTGCRPNEGCGLRTVNSAQLFNEVTAVIKQGIAKGLLYDIE